MSLAFPHWTLRAAELRLSNLRLDDKAPSRDVLDSDFELVSLYRLQEDWNKLELDCEVRLDHEEVNAASAEYGSIELSLVAFCRSSNARVSVPLPAPDSNGHLSGPLSLSRPLFHGKVEVYVVVAGIDAEDHPLWLVESDRWRLYFDEPDVPPIEGMLRVKWAAFDEPKTESVPDQARKQPFYVAVQEQPPIVYLNSDFSGLAELLTDDRSRPPAEKALRDSEYRRIASAAWNEMFIAAVAAVGRDGEGDAQWPAEDWKKQVLEGLLPDFYPDISVPVEALNQLRNDMDGSTPQLQGLLQVAIANQIGAAKSLRNDIKRVIK